MPIPEPKPKPKPKPEPKPEPKPKPQPKPQPTPQAKPATEAKPQFRSLSSNNKAFGTPTGQAGAPVAAPNAGETVNVSALNFRRRPNLTVDRSHGFRSGDIVTIRVRVNVNEAGKLTDVNIVSGGNPRLNRDLLRQLRQQLSFNPHKVNGVARKARGDFSINIQVR